MHALWQDIRYGLRMLAKNPGFTVVAVLTLALGIGANTAIFSLIDIALLRSLPVTDPHRLLILKWTARNSPNTKGYHSYMACPPTDATKPTPRVSPVADELGKHGCSFSYPMFREFRSLRNVFSSAAALGGDVGLILRGNGAARFVHGELVSGAFFDTLGVDAALGRRITDSDDKPGAPPVGVLAYGYWQSAFGSDPGVIGRTVWLNNVPITIVGVAAKNFPGLDPVRSRQLWLPLSLQPQLGKNLNGTISGEHPALSAGDDLWWLYIVARLKPGATLREAQAAADATFRSGVVGESKTLFKPEDAPRLVLMPAREGLSALRDRLARPLTILMAAVCVVLLIACANVAGLTLARSAARQKELSVRLALGAGRARIARQLLTESVLLSTFGGASGILLAFWSVRSLVAFMSRGGLWPGHLTARLDLRVLGFTAAASVLTGILFGLAPTFRGVRMDLTPALKDGTTTFASGASRGRFLSLGGSLVIAQVALAILILSGAGLLLRTLQNLKSIDPGFDTRNILLFGIDPTLNGYTGTQTRNLYAQLQERLEALPGVLSVSYSFDPLLSGNLWTTSFHIEGQTPNLEHLTEALAVGPNFFETMRIPLLAGRTFSPQDLSSGPGSKWSPVLINEAFVRQFFKNENPIGRHILDLGGKDTTCEIVGIVGDAKYQTLRSEMSPTAYVPQKGGDTTFEVRTATNPSPLIPVIRSILRQLDNSLPLSRLKTQSEQIEGSLFQERLIARLSSFFGALSLLLACVGLYGLLSYEVTRRTREIGVRVALGAQPADILRFVVGQGVALSAVGAIAGIVVALGLTRYLGSLLYAVQPDDPLTFAAVAILLATVAFAASYVPARRAIRVDPVVALRYE